MFRTEPPPTAANWALFEFKRLDFPGPKSIARAQLLCTQNGVSVGRSNGRKLLRAS